MKPFFPAHRSMAALLAMALGCAVLPAHGLDNPRIINFAGQTVPAAPATNVTFTSTDGSMTIDQLRAGTGLTFPAVVSYGLGNSGMSGQGTQLTIDPASSAVPYRLAVNDQRTSSYQWISAECLDPANPSGPLVVCNLGDTAQFPRTNYPTGSGAYWQTPAVSWSSPWLQVTTPGYFNQNIQSNGLYIDLPPTVRKVYFYAINYTNGVDSIFGTVFVADAPSVSKAFAPANVKPGEQSTLTITLKGPGFGQAIGAVGNDPAGPAGVAGAVPGVQLMDMLPAPLTLVSASHTCTGGTLTAVAGSSTITLSDATLPNDGCAITAVVQWPSTTAGYQACKDSPKVTNTITPPSQFSTLVGQMDTPATTDLDCTYVAPPSSPTPVPTLGMGALLLSSAGIVVLGFLRRRRPMH